MYNSTNYVEKPIHLVSVNSLGKLVLHAQAIQYIMSIPAPLSIMSIAGPYRTGKSFLLNSLISSDDSKNSFEVGHTVNEKTHGLWIWGKPILAQNQDGKITNVIVMDSQGFSSVQSTHDKRIVTLAILLSSCFMYNSKGPIDKDSIFDLQFVIEVARIIGEKENKLVNCDFHWILRDFHLDLVNQIGSKITPNQYMENCLLQAQQKVNQKTIQTLKEYFPYRQCHCLIRPNLDHQKHQERPQFVRQILQLKKILKGIKSFNSLDGQSFATIIQSYVDSMNNNQQIDNVFQQGYDCRVRLDCLQKLNNKLKKLESQSEDADQIDEKLLGIKTQMVQFYKQRMCSHKQIKVLDSDVNEVIQEYQFEHSYKNFSSVKMVEKERTKKWLHIPRPSYQKQQQVRVSIHCSQTEMKSQDQNHRHKRLQSGLKHCSGNNSGTSLYNKADKSLILKAQQLQVKIHRKDLQMDTTQNQLRQLKLENQKLRSQVTIKQDEVIQTMQKNTITQKIKNTQIEELTESNVKKQKQLRVIKSQIQKIKLLSEEKVQYLQKKLDEFDKIKQKEIIQLKQKYKPRIQQLTQELQELKIKQQADIAQLKQIYKQREQQKKKTLYMQQNTDQESLFQQLRLNSIEIQELKTQVQDLKAQNRKLKQEIDNIDFKYQSKQRLLRESLEQQNKRYSEIEEHLKAIYQGKLSTKDKHIKELQAKIHSLNEIVKIQNQKLIKKLEETEFQHTEEKEDLFNMNTELRNGCLQSLQRVGHLREQLAQKDQWMQEQQIEKTKLKEELQQLHRTSLDQNQNYSSLLSNLKRQINQLNQKIQYLKDESNDKSANYSKETNKLQRKIIQLNTKLSNVNQICQEKAQALEQMHNQKHKIQIQNFELSSKIKSKQKQIQELNQCMIDSKRMHSQQLMALKRQLQQSKQQKSQLIESISHLNKKLSENYNNIQVMFNEKYQHQCSKYEENLKEIKENERRKSDISDHSVIEVVKLQEKNKYLNKQVQVLQQEKNRIQKQYQQRNTKNETKIKQMFDKQRQLTKQIALLKHKSEWNNELVNEEKRSLVKLQKSHQQRVNICQKSIEDLKDINNELKKKLKQLDNQLTQQKLESQSASFSYASQLAKCKKLLSIYQKDQEIVLQNISELQTNKEQSDVMYQNHLNLFSSKFNKLKKQKEEIQGKYKQARILIDQLSQQNQLINNNYQKDFDLWVGKLERMESLLVLNRKKGQNTFDSSL